MGARSGNSEGVEEPRGDSKRGGVRKTQAGTLTRRLLKIISPNLQCGGVFVEAVCEDLCSPRGSKSNGRISNGNPMEKRGGNEVEATKVGV